jgi:hypothetical protein
LEVTEVTLPSGQNLRVPTPDETLRIKGYLIVRTAIRCGTTATSQLLLVRMRRVARYSAAGSRAPGSDIRE